VEPRVRAQWIQAGPHLDPGKQAIPIVNSFVQPLPSGVEVAKPKVDLRDTEGGEVVLLSALQALIEQLLRSICPSRAAGCPTQQASH